MVKHSPNERLRLLQQRNMANNGRNVDDMPALEDPNAGLPDVGEALRRAAEVRADAEAQDNVALPTPLHPNVNDRRRGRGEQGGEEFADDLGSSFVGDDFPEVPPPWISQIINAAVTAAATAVAAIPQRQQAAPRSALAPTKLSDRKVPDFWESKPEEWFRIFDAHLAFFSPTEEASFNTLLPLLTPAALSKMTPILRVHGRTPYTTAKTTLLKHFAKTPRDLCRELRELRTLGDNTPSEILAHMRGLMPDPDVLFEVILLDLLPSNARDAALQHSSLDSMAAAADLIVAENAVAATTSSISSLQVQDDGDTSGPLVAAVSAPAAAAAGSDLCQVHARFGKAAYKCASPATCRMKNFIRQRPPQRTPSTQGNSKAGSRS